VFLPLDFIPHLQITDQQHEPCTAQSRLTEESVEGSIAVTASNEKNESTSKEEDTASGSKTPIGSDNPYEEERTFHCLPPILFLSDSQQPIEITRVTSEFKGTDCFTKGCKW